MKVMNDLINFKNIIIEIISIIINSIGMAIAHTEVSVFPNMRLTIKRLICIFLYIFFILQLILILTYTFGIMHIGNHIVISLEILMFFNSLILIRFHRLKIQIISL